MCTTNNINDIKETKVCKTCGRVMPLTHFRIHPKSKDNRSNICNDCFAEHNKQKRIKNIKEGNSKLAEFTPRELMEELEARGYRGELTYTTIKTIKIG